MDRTGADLLTNLLCINPARRPTAEQALEHVWFWSDPMPARLGT
jgi:serine/threonine-protein kinase BUR1